MKELDLQKRIIDEVKAAGGWGRKWASTWQNGVPDLILILPPSEYCCESEIVFVEVKLIERANFNFTTAPVKTTRLQRQEMERILEAGGIAFVVVGVITPEGGRLYPVPHYSEDFMSTRPYTSWKPRKIFLDAVPMLSGYARSGDL